jgi:hypothetical protein
MIALHYTGNGNFICEMFRVVSKRLVTSGDWHTSVVTYLYFLVQISTDETARSDL